MSQAASSDPVAFERANYMQTLASFTSPYDWRLISGSPQS
jgi:hypothetical protein